MPPNVSLHELFHALLFDRLSETRRQNRILTTKVKRTWVVGTFKVRKVLKWTLLSFRSCPAWDINTTHLIEANTIHTKVEASYFLLAVRIFSSLFLFFLSFFNVQYIPYIFSKGLIISSRAMKISRKQDPLSGRKRKGVQADDLGCKSNLPHCRSVL